MVKFSMGAPRRQKRSVDLIPRQDGRGLRRHPDRRGDTLDEAIIADVLLDDSRCRIAIVGSTGWAVVSRTDRSPEQDRREPVKIVGMLSIMVRSRRTHLTGVAERSGRLGCRPSSKAGLPCRAIRTSTVIGSSSPEQLASNIAATDLAPKIRGTASTRQADRSRD